jgi:hypothetical protein
MADAQSTSYLDLSDEDFMKAPMQEAVSESVQETVEKEEPEQQAEVIEETQEVSDTGLVAEESVATDTQKEAESEENKEKAADKQETVVDNEKETKETIDYKAAYEKLTAPFKANGKEISVQNVDDAVALMQMGANYSKKMAALKPHLRMVKMLEKHGLLDETKLSYLIDLSSQNPQAIAKLVKDSGVDPLEMDMTTADNYKPKTRTVDDKEMELDAVLEEVKDSSNYKRMIDVVASQWDASSQQTIADTPQILKIISSHMDSGIFDLIQKEMDSERMFGRLEGLSDIEAYRKVGDALHARGSFDFLAKKQQNTQRTVSVTKPAQVQDDKLKDKKRAAAPVKSATVSQVKSDFNPLALSDEEFAKLAKTSFL